VSADPGRRLALEALLDVQRGGPLDRALQRVRTALPGQPAAAAGLEELVKGALQWQARYDHVIQHFSRRQASQDQRVRAVLHLALHQLLTSRQVPAYAAVHQAGELLRAAGRARAVGYVNAVLQSLQRYLAQSHHEQSLAAVHELFADPQATAAEYLAAWWSYPGWLVERWCECYGDAETEQLLEHLNTPPPVTLHVLPGHDVEAAAAALLEAGAATLRSPDHPRCLQLVERPDRARLASLLETAGGLIVQDAGAQTVLEWLTRGGADLALTAGPVVDLCAAPGGKSVHLRSLLAPERPLIAVDLKPRRLSRVRQNRDRLQVGAIQLLAGDGTRPPLQPATFGAVLVDGPCSGTGVGRRHPEGRWRLRPGTLQRNGERLLQLAHAAADLLQDGGRLYYATCSLEPEENEEVVTALLAARSDLEPAQDPDDPAGADRRDCPPWKTWLPWRTGTDGFFAARLQRRIATGRAGAR